MHNKISKDRKRDTKKRKPKRVILVSYEGDNKTEKNYLENFKSRDKQYRIIEVPGNDTDPVSLVKQTNEKTEKENLDLKSYDKAYCIFDTDAKKEKVKEIEKAINLAKKKKIIPIVSTPCIELWFLLHYELTTAELTNKSVIEKLKTHCHKYDKNYNIYDDIKNYTNDAIKKAKWLENYQIENGKKLQTIEANPYTEMYKLVEELIK